MDESSGMARVVDIAPGKRAGNRRLPQRAREGESISRTGATKDRQNGDSVSRTSRVLCNGTRCAERLGEAIRLADRQAARIPHTLERRQRRGAGVSSGEK